MFKNINESFEKRFNDINNNNLVAKLEECLNRINESEMSAEDQRDSDLIRSMLDKIYARSNARFTPEEDAVLTKYGLKRNNYRKTIDDDAGRPIFDDRVDGKGRTWGSKPFSNGIRSKMNLADRARKRPERRDNRVTADHEWIDTPNDVINQHTNYRFSDDHTLQSRERDAAEYKAGKNYTDMENHLSTRKNAQLTLDTADDTLSSRISDAKTRRDDVIRKAMSDYDRDTEFYRDSHKRSVERANKNLADSQAEIDRLLKRDKKEERLNESPSYELHPQYDGRQSFYGKTRVDDENGVLTLYSYDTPVARISHGNVELLPKWDWSQTTLRHVKEFLKQNGFEASSLKQMKDTYL